MNLRLLYVCCKPWPRHMAGWNHCGRTPASMVPTGSAQRQHWLCIISGIAQAAPVRCGSELQIQARLQAERMRLAERQTVGAHTQAERALFVAQPHHLEPRVIAGGAGLRTRP